MALSIDVMMCAKLFANEELWPGLLAERPRTVAIATGLNRAAIALRLGALRGLRAPLAIVGSAG